ncbi:MAG: protein kinase [Paludibacteraceae bacterium]|nr:protein kinase [Paludibacteraceae bacterium]
MNDASSILPSGATLQGGKYRIIRVLGQGGFGITYLAEQTGLGMKVAIKEFFLKGSCQRDATTSRVSVPVTDNKELVAKCLKKFKSEARKIASLNNDHIVSIIDIFDENGTSYYVMKYLDGGSLADRIRHASLPETQALSIIREIADALKSIHSNGLLHLDIKPANILFDDRGRAVLIDFGVSKYVDSEKDTTTTSSLVGFSRGFAPLEQINATVNSLSPATDIYSLGATLYNLVVGITPPDASTVMDMGLPAFPSDISLDVQNTIEQSMQPRRKDRPQDINAFLEMLPENSSIEEEDVTVISVQPDSSKGADINPVPSTQKGKSFFYVALALFVGAFVWAGVSLYQKKHAAVPVQDNSRVVQLEKEVNALTTRNSSLQKQVNDMKSQVSTSSQNKSALQKQVDDLTRKNASQASQITSLQRENANLKSQVNSYKPDAERWRRQMEVNNR